MKFWATWAHLFSIPVLIVGSQDYPYWLVLRDPIDMIDWLIEELRSRLFTVQIGVGSNTR